MAAGDENPEETGQGCGKPASGVAGVRLSALLGERLALLRGPALRAPLAVLFGIGAFLLRLSPGIAQTLTLDLGGGRGGGRRLPNGPFS